MQGYYLEKPRADHPLITTVKLRTAELPREPARATFALSIA